MVARDAKEYPETIPSEIQGGRPLHFLRVLSRYPLLDYGTMHSMHGDIMRILRRDLRVVDCLRPGVLTAFEFEGRGSESRKFVQATWGDAICYDLGVLGSDVMFRTD
jgi:hypothetical protein